MGKKKTGVNINGHKIEDSFSQVSNARKVEMLKKMQQKGHLSCRQSNLS